MISDCADGTYGLSCQYKCGNCFKNGPCDKTYGGCTSCGAGYNGNTCVDGKYTCNTIEIYMNTCRVLLTGYSECLFAFEYNIKLSFRLSYCKFIYISCHLYDTLQAFIK